MYKLLVVDDDMLVRNRVISLLPLKELDLELCGEAEDAMQALELFSSCQPQIVIMDIQIPFMDGLEVSKKMLAENPDVKIIIITGYGSVEYAQNALRNQVQDFLLKPIDSDELNNVLLKTIATIEKERSDEIKKKRMERLLEEGMPILRNRYFLSLLQAQQKDCSIEKTQQYLKDFEIPVDCSSIDVIIIVPDYRGMIPSEQMTMQSVLEDELRKSIRAIQSDCLFIYDSTQRMIVIVYGNRRHIDFTLEQKISALRDKLRYIYQFDIKASIGNTVDSFSNISDSYMNAVNALGYMDILGNNNVVNSSNVKQLSSAHHEIKKIEYGVISSLLRSENSEELNKEALNYIEQLIYVSNYSFSFVQQKAIELVCIILMAAQELGLNTDTVFKDCSPVTALFSVSSVFDVKTIITDTLSMTVDSIKQIRANNTDRTLADAKNYISLNFSDPAFNIESVSEYLNLSPKYLAQLFKKTENCSFSDYLNKVRIEKAKELLEKTHLRVYEVAEKVGFENSKYFFQVFRQLTDMSPREYYKNSLSD